VQRVTDQSRLTRQTRDARDLPVRRHTPTWNSRHDVVDALV
jgi:hypothetical protein